MNMEGICETGPTVYSPYPRRLESLTICGCNYKGSKFLLNVSGKVFVLVFHLQMELVAIMWLTVRESFSRKTEKGHRFGTSVSFEISSGRLLIHFCKQCNKLSQDAFLTNNTLHQTSHLQPPFWNFVCRTRTSFQDQVFLLSRGALPIKKHMVRQGSGPPKKEKRKRKEKQTEVKSRTKKQNWTKQKKAERSILSKDSWLLFYFSSVNCVTNTSSVS